MHPTVGLLLPAPDRAPTAPHTQPIGRAALALADRLTVLIGSTVESGELIGHIATPQGWRAHRARPHAVIDRFPSFSRPQAYQALLHGLGSVPILNPPRLTALLRDKLRTQHALYGLGMPPVCSRADHFGLLLQEWGSAFVKPRFGSFGRGVHRVHSPPPARAIVDHVDQPLFLQRAIAPPHGYGGVALRILVQRLPDFSWRAYPPVARHHPTDPVVNRARGARVGSAHDLFGLDIAHRAQDLALAVAQRFPTALELGVDAVLDPQLQPHLIEVNARPRGRLQALALQQPERFGALHALATTTPFETAAYCGLSSTHTPDTSSSGVDTSMLRTTRKPTGV